MVRIILGIIVGFIAWSIIWVGGDAVLTSLSPGWYGAHQDATQVALANNAPFAADTTIAFIHLIRSVIASVLAGFLAAFVAGENRRSPLILGAILLLVGIMVQYMMANVLPLWYHAIFLVLLMPMTIIGAKLRTASNA